MSARRFPRWLPPVAFVGTLAVFLLLSNQTATLPSGAAAITSMDEYAQLEAKVQALTLEPLRAYDAGERPSAEGLKELRAASAMVDRMNAFQPLASNYFFLSGKLHGILGEERVAEERYRQCVFLFPNDAEARPRDRTQIVETGAEAAYQLSLLLISHGDVKGAFEAADAAAKTIPNSPNYLVARASALNELRRVPEAKQDLREALRLDPKNAKAATLLRFISRG